MKPIVFLLVAFVVQFSQFTRAASGTFLIKPSDLRLTNIRILAERPMGDRTEIEFTTDIQNLESGQFADVTVFVVTSNAAPSLIVTDGMLQFASLAPMATVSDNAISLIITVENVDVASTRAQILDGSILDYNAMEELVYAGPAIYVDEAADDGFVDALITPLGMTLVFSNGIPLVDGLRKGDLLLADPAAGGYRPQVPTGFAQAHLAQFIPFEIDSVTVVGDRTHVNGNKRTITQVLRSGTFVGDTDFAYRGGRDPYDPTVENTYTDEEQAERDLQAEIERQTDPTSSKLADLAGLNAIPIRFNEVRIGDFIDLSGEVLLRSSGLKLQITMRDFQFTRAVAHIDAGLVANLVLETVSSNNNVSVPILEKEKRIAFVPLPPVPITIAGIPMTLGGNFSVTVGAEANAPGGISIPIQSAIVVGAEVGWDGNQTFAAPITEFIKPHVSDPTLFQATEVSARAWAEGKFELTFGDALQLVSTGPSLAVRAEGKFTANPFANPWWKLEFTGELLGAFNLNLLTFNVVGAEASFYKHTFYTNDAGGPLITLPAPAAVNKKGAVASSFGGATFKPVAGGNARWGVAFQPKPGQGAYGHGTIVPLAGGDTFTAASSALMTFFARWAPDGSLVWMQNFNSIIQTIAGEQLRDGRIALLGKAGLDWFVAFYDTDGNQLAFKRYNIGNSVELSDMKIAYNETGVPSLIVVGYKNQTIVTDSDPFIIKLDENGNVVWANILELPGDDEFFGVTVLRNGDFVMSGRTGFNFGDDPSMNVTPSGFLAKVSSAGELVWARAIASRWGMALNDVVEAADGTLFAAGSNNDLVLNYYPSILIAKFTAEGELVDHVLLGEDPDEEDMLPVSGDTPYDYAADIELNEDGLYIAGTTGLGAQRAGFVAALTEELGVRWFTSLDGPNADAIEDIKIEHEGLTIMGWSDSIMPFGVGGEHAVMLLRYPFEGILRMHPDTGVETAYLQPRTFLSSQETHFIAVDNSDPSQPKFMKTAPVSGFWGSLVRNETFTAIPSGVRVTPTMARLERVEPTLITAMDDWESYHQLAPAKRGPLADGDGDGRSNTDEYFFGTNPHQPDSTPAPIIILDQDGETEVARMTFDVAPWANLPIVLLTGRDLNAPLAPANGFTVKEEASVTPGKRTLSIQMQTQRENQLFYRIGVQPPSP